MRIRRRADLELPSCGCFPEQLPKSVDSITVKSDVAADDCNLFDNVSPTAIPVLVSISLQGDHWQ